VHKKLIFKSLPRRFLYTDFYGSNELNIPLSIPFSITDEHDGLLTSSFEEPEAIFPEYSSCSSLIKRKDMDT